MKQTQPFQDLLEKAKSAEAGTEAETLKVIAAELQALISTITKQEKITKLKAKIAQLEKE